MNSTLKSDCLKRFRVVLECVFDENDNKRSTDANIF